jgi:hypothetical protein
VLAFIRAFAAKIAFVNSSLVEYLVSTLPPTRLGNAMIKVSEIRDLFYPVDEGV